VAYLALRFDADADSVEVWSDALLELGALSVDVADPGAGTPGETALFAEPGSESDLRWPIARVTALFAAGTDLDDVLARAGAELGLAPPAHERFELADEDWVRATQAQFAPVRITERLWVVPSWCDAPDPAAINVTLDPGLAFGTGTHPTTRLCLEWLAAMLARGATVLDYGCGSGILAIAAARLGAGRVTGVDIDPQAVAAARENARINGVAAEFVVPDGLPPAATYDVVVANILANPLRLLAPALAARCARDGRIVLSGVLTEQTDEVAAAYAPWFIMSSWKGEDDWVALEGVRRASPQPA
jgi:ribosomal protein L11 methyltransferase